jgi:hypothetical protein
MHKLDEIALTIELVLISIVEGVALTRLGEDAIPLLRAETLMYVPYVLAGLAILLVFWSQAILHAVSFIRWPLKMEHMLLYFLAAFLQIIAYSNITDGAAWFGWWSAFSLLAFAIYAVDLKVIKDAAVSFTGPGGEVYIAKVLARHIFEFKFLVPVTLTFNIAAWALMVYAPSLFGNPLAYAALGGLQALISLGALIECVRNFKERSSMIPSLFK